MIIVRIVQFVKIVQLVQLDYYGYIKFFGVFVGTWVGAFTLENITDLKQGIFLWMHYIVLLSNPLCFLIRDI